MLTVDSFMYNFCLFPLTFVIVDVVYGPSLFTPNCYRDILKALNKKHAFKDA